MELKGRKYSRAYCLEPVEPPGTKAADCPYYSPSPTLLPGLHVSHLSSLEIYSSSLCSADDLSLHLHSHGTRW